MTVMDYYHKVFIMNYMFFCKYMSAQAQKVQREERERFEVPVLSEIIGDSECYKMKRNG